MRIQDYPIALRAACMQYAHFLKGKSIVLVGRAGYLLERQGGSFIDSHDIVVRINDPRPYAPPTDGMNATAARLEQKNQYATLKPCNDFIPIEYQPAIGRRTCILYTIYRGSLDGNMPRFIRGGGRYIIKMRVSSQEHATHRECQSPLPIIPYSFAQRRILAKHIGSNPFGGTTALSHLLQFDFKRLLLVGFRCHFDKPTVWEHGHNGLNDFRYMRGIVAEDPRVTADDYITDLFARNLPDNRDSKRHH